VKLGGEEDKVEYYCRAGGKSGRLEKIYRGEAAGNIRGKRKRRQRDKEGYDIFSFFNFFLLLLTKKSQIFWIPIFLAMYTCWGEGKGATLRSKPSLQQLS
jgi:hypothetical protein